MSSDDILRIENALATLAELSADHERRMARVEESLVVLVKLARSHNEGMDAFHATMTEFRATMAEFARNHDELARNHDQLARNHDELARNHDELARNHNEGLAEMRAAQAEASLKIAALADAQIRTDAVMAKLAGKVNVIDDKRQG